MSVRRSSWLLAGLLVVSGCQCEPEAPVPDAGPEPLDAGVLAVLRVEPSTLRFDTLGQRQAFKVYGLAEGGADLDVTDRAGFSSREPAVAQVTPDALVTAVANGRTVIDVTVGELTTRLFLEVSVDQRPPAYVEFFNVANATGLRRPAWWGRTEPFAQVEIVDGPTTANAVADDEGLFVIEVPLFSNRRNELHVLLTDEEGNVSPRFPLSVEQKDALPRSGVLALVGGDSQTGLVGQPTPAPLRVIATGAGGVALGGQRVTFRALSGGASFSGQDTLEVFTAPDGKASATPTLGFVDGSGKQLLMAQLEGDWGMPVIFNLSAAVPSLRPASVSGRVLTEESTAVPGATIWLKDSRGVVLGNTVTSGVGQFSFENVPPGSGYSVMVDGRTVTLPGKYPDMIFDVNVVAGIENPLPAAVVLPRLPEGVVLPLDANGLATATTEVKLNVAKGHPPLVLTVPVGTKVTWPAGLPASEHLLRLVVVPTFGVPMPFPNGLSTTNVIAVQPANTLFDPPLPLRVPNVDQIPPGTSVRLFSFDHAKKEYLAVGTVTVDSSGQYLVSDPGSGVRKGAWHLPPPPEPCFTTVCASPSGRAPRSDPECPTQPECTCSGPGLVSRPCRPGQQICIPNVVCGAEDSIQIRMSCSPQNNSNADGTKVKIVKPKNGAWFQTRKDVVFTAKTCPEGREQEITWETDEGDIQLQSDPFGPVFRVRFTEEHFTGTTMTARFKNAQDSVSVRITDKCATAGVVQVCGTESEPLDTDGNLFKIKGPLRMGLDGKPLGILFDGDVEVDLAGKSVRSVAGTDFVWVTTSPVRLPVYKAPFTINGATARFSSLSEVLWFDALNLPAKDLGADLEVQDVTIIEGGATVNARLKLPRGFKLPNAESFTIDKIELLDGQIPKFSITQKFEFEVPWLNFSIGGDVKWNFPEELEVNGQIRFGPPGAKTKGIDVGVSFNWKKNQFGIKVGVVNWNIPMPGPAVWAALQDLSTKGVWSFDPLEPKELEIDTRFTRNEAFGPLPQGLVEAKVGGKAELWEKFTLTGEVTALRNALQVRKASLVVADGLVKLGGSIAVTLNEVDGAPGLLSVKRTGLFGDFRVTIDPALGVSGTADVTVEIFGHTLAGYGFAAEGVWQGDPYFTLSGRIGPFDFPVFGKLPSQSLLLRFDFHAPYVHVQKCADYEEAESKLLAGGEATFEVPPGTTAAMILLERFTTTYAPFSLRTPAGVVISPPGGPGAAYFEDGDTGDSFYLLEAPAAGGWTVVQVADLPNAKSVSLRLPNAAPAITLGALRPLPNGSVGIDWVASDPDDVARLTLYYDTDDKDFDGVAIATTLTEQDAPGTFTWAPSALPGGEYYVYAVLDDRRDHPARVYSPNKLRLKDPMAPAAPTAVRARLLGTGARVEWAAVAGANKYRVQVDQAGAEPRQLASGGTIAQVPLENGGTYRITVMAVDEAGRVGAASDSLELQPRAANANVPRITSQACLVAKVGRQWQYAASVSDADSSDTAAWLIEAGPPGLTVSSAGLVSWSPAEGQEGSHPVSLRVQDGAGLSSVQRFTLKVAPQIMANLEPEIVSVAPSWITPGQPLTYAVRAVDPDGDTLAFALEVSPQGMTLNPTTGVLSWSPQRSDFAQGPVHAVIKVEDGEGGLARQRLSLTIEDTDGDGLRDGFELGAGLDPLRADSDGDGLPDGEEDGDADGLENLGEQSAGASPNVADTDGDGLNDQQEVDFGSNPTLRDTDDDGLEDPAEQTRGTHPANPDTDGDGARDGDEVLAGTDPLLRAPDDDGDGLSNDLEKVLRLDPARPDTDTDTLLDGDELTRGLNPRVRDTDGDGVDDAVDPNPTTAGDLDLDGLSDDRERLLGTDLTSADTDGDGRSDGMEVAGGLDPLLASDNPRPPPPAKPATGASQLANSVEGGITDVGEISLEENGDFDGIPDGWEVSYGLSPTDPADALLDSDGDGLSNVAEFRAGTNPRSVDTDGDGVSDADELRVGTDPLDSNSHDQDLMLASIQTVPSRAHVALNTIEGAQPYPLRLLGNMSDGSQVDLTSNAGTTWSSSMPSRLTVTAEGVLYPVPASGPEVEVVITARNGTKVTTTTIEVEVFEPRPVGALRAFVAGTLRRMSLQPGRLYVAAEKGVLLADIQRPREPTLIALVPVPPPGVNDVTTASGTVYAATGTGIMFLDVAAVSGATQVGFVPVAGGVGAIALSGNHLYAMSGSKLLVVEANAPTPSSLVDANADGVDDRIVGSLELGSGTAGRLAVYEGLAAVDVARSLVLVDVRNPTAPLRLGSSPLGLAAAYPLAIDLGPRTAFTASASSLQAFDVTTPQTPTRVGLTTQLMAPSAVRAHGAYAFTVDTSPITSPMRIFRTREPGRLEPVAGSLIWPAEASDIAVEGAFIYTVLGSTITVGQFLAWSDWGTRAPDVLIASPPGGSTLVEGHALDVQVNAVDDVNVASVSLLIDGVAAGAPLLTPGPRYDFSVMPPASATAGTTFILEAIATDTAGNVGRSAPMPVRVVADQPPTVVIVEPANATIVRGQVRIGVSALDDEAISEVEFFAGLQSLGKLTSRPFELMWDTASIPKVSYRLTAVARDVGGNSTTSAEVSVTVENDPPTVVLVSPTSGATVRGQVTINALATDDAPGVTVQFFAGATSLGTVGRAPFTATWNSCLSADGPLQLSARASDRGGNQTAATPIPVTLDNAQLAPQLTANPGPAKVTLAWTACGVPTSYNLYWSTSPGVSTASTRLAGVSRPFAHTGLASGTTYYYRVAAVRGTQEGPLSNEVTATPGLPGICSLDGFCVDFPKYPKNSEFVALWGAAPNDLWAADGKALLLHWNGLAWSSLLDGLTTEPAISALWGSSANDVWAVGRSGQALHWNGTRWSSTVSGTTQPLSGVWGSAPNDVWAIGAAGTIIHWDGAAWASVSSGTTLDLTAIWGAGAGDVWIGVDEPLSSTARFLRWEGTGWASVTGPTTSSGAITSLWGSSTNDVWATSSWQFGLIHHWDGTAWSQVNTGLGFYLHKVWGSGPSDVWVTGRSEHAAHFDGTSWSRLSGHLLRTGEALWGFGPGDVWLGGAQGKIVHWNGSRFSATLGLPDWDLGSVLAVWGSTNADVWAVGAYGAIHHFDGSTWALVPSGTFENLRGVWGSSANDVWAVGDRGTNLHWDGTQWSAAPPVTPVTELRGVAGSPTGGLWTVGVTPTTPGGLFATVLQRSGSNWVTAYSAKPWNETAILNALWAASPNDAWAVGENEYFQVGFMLRWNGTTWTIATHPQAEDLKSIWGSGPADVWAGGDNELLHWDGFNWSTIASNRSVGALTGTSATDAWAFTSRGFEHWDGAAWSVSGRARFRAGTATTIGTNTWAGGANNTVLRFNGTEWSTSLSTELPSSARLNAAVSAGPNAAWAVGSTILRWDGVTWADALGPLSPQAWSEFRAVWAHSETEAWAVGDQGRTMHWDGTAWSAITSGVTANLVAVWGSSANDVWATSTQGHTLHWNGASWTDVPNPSLNFSPLNTLWGSGPNDVWAGANLHWNGTAWATVPVPSGWGQSKSIWGAGPNAIWAVGYGGFSNDPIIYWDGMAWSPLPGLPLVTLEGVWGRSASDVWAVGRESSAGVVIHWDGSSWTSRSTGLAEVGWLNVSGDGAGALRLVGTSNSGGIPADLILKYEP